MTPVENAATEAVRKESRSLAIALGIVLVGTIILAIIGFCFLNKPDEIVEGQVDATSVRISGKLPGRVRDFYVKEGDMVKAGDTLVHIHSSFAEAQLSRAEGMQTVAEATNEKVDAGTRSQIIATASSLLAQATAARQIAQKTYDRMENLYKEGVISEQKRDEAKAAYEAAVAGEKAAQSQLSLAQAGAQSEDKRASAAMVQVARGGVAEVESLLEDQYLVAPCDGQIDQIYPVEGELVSLGAPIMSLLKIEEPWITFNVREALLNDLKIGQKVKLMLPALDRREIEAEVYYVRDMGSYAAWRATKATGDWDSRTFEIKARPLEKIDGLRPGMSAIYLTRE